MNILHLLFPQKRKSKLGSWNKKHVLQDYVPENLAILSDFESPPSPPWSYDNIMLSDEEFHKPPPELPHHLPVTIRDEPSTSTNSHQRLSPRPSHIELNHLYIHKTEGEPFVALRSTSKLQHKYVTTQLYKFLTRERWWWSNMHGFHLLCHRTCLLLSVDDNMFARLIKLFCRKWRNKI